MPAALSDDPRSETNPLFNQNTLRLGAFAAGSNLAAGRTIDPEGRPLRLLLPRRVRPVERAVFTITVRDAAGHQTTVRRTYKRR